jgi:hypothetical protein
MEAILDFFDTNAKRWLGVLTAAFLVSVVFLTRSFMNVLAPDESAVPVQQSTSAETGQVQSKADSSWGGQSQAHPHEPEEIPVFSRVSPFDNDRPSVVKVDPVARQEVVHQQAEYLRQLIAAGKLPKGFGNLTKEQVDEMEKKGVTIN